MSVRALGLCLLAVALSACLADPPPPSPAASLGPEKYTVHSSGTLRDMVDSLSKLTRRQIRLQTSQGPGAPTTAKPLEDAPVSLNFDNATLDVILLSLCTQAGVIYDVPEGFYGSHGPPITLRPGDPAVDGRPTCVLDDYILRVTRVVAAQSREADFRWGSASAEKPALASYLQITLQVTPRSPEAALRLAGVQTEARAVANAGDPIQSEAHMPRGFFSPMQRDPWGGGGIQPTQISLPLPDPAATVLTRLEGSLTCFSEVKVTEIKIPPDSGGGPGGSPEGKTFTEDDVKATVKTWKLEGTSLRVEIDAECPPLPHEPSQFWLPRDWLKADLLGADGRQAGLSSSGYSGVGKIKMQFQFGLQPLVQTPEGTPQPPPIVPDVLVVTFYRTGPADKIVPFVIENIPLP